MILSKIFTLSADLLLYIFTFSDVKGLSVMARISKTWHVEINSPKANLALWKHIYNNFMSCSPRYFNLKCDSYRDKTRFALMNQNLPRTCLLRLYRVDFLSIPKFGLGEDILAQPLVNKPLNEWQAFITGPLGTVYENGNFELSIIFPLLYPLKAPRVTFLTKIWHSNISVDGRISLDILCQNWSPALQVSTMLIGVRALLSDPNWDDPLNAQAARMYRDNPQIFEQTASSGLLCMHNGDTNYTTKYIKFIGLGLRKCISFIIIKDMNKLQTEKNF
ncbi:ubiquitin conjugating enzyme [Reticulomyxa filosa]|uniref:Ubiquitin conjugating enzyme n=1 Tax=Reticulomyxa filosa TaxID=46433 RepID=X6M9R3_RETFI|nr:ubiquitin conjugating enzyme [Reticulomyxa filosa]|eukprot:ETO09755.1 ubiquitin conjugating enzyme [Reticulomyxa filosa]